MRSGRHLVPGDPSRNHLPRGPNLPTSSHRPPETAGAKCKSGDRHASILAELRLPTLAIRKNAAFTDCRELHLPQSTYDIDSRLVRKTPPDRGEQPKLEEVAAKHANVHALV